MKNTCGGIYQQDQIRQTPDGGIALCATRGDSLFNAFIYLRKTGINGISGCYDSLVNPILLTSYFQTGSGSTQSYLVILTNDGAQTIVSSMVPQDSVICVSQVGVQGINIQPGTFFPNPAQDELLIRTNLFDSEQAISFSLYDLQGRKILEQLYDKTGPVDLSDVHNGYYVAVVKGKEKEMRRKVMVQR